MLILNEKQLAEQANNKYLMQIFEKINHRINNPLSCDYVLTEDDIQYLCFECEDFIVNIKKSENGRWSYWKNMIINIQNRYFSFGYEVGLTESQPNDFDNREIIEVFPQEIVKTITEIVWTEKKLMS